MGRKPYYPLPSARYNYQSPAPITYPFGPPQPVYATKHKKRKEQRQNIPRTIDVIGCGAELTVRGHIDLLINLPVHHEMHQELLWKFSSKPGNYEGRYNKDDQSTASVANYGNGYLAIHFVDDLSQPEMSEFLMKKNWRLLYSTFDRKDGLNIIYEKWTNQLQDKN